MSEPRYLLDVNVFIALMTENHTHFKLVMNWFETPNLQWALCSFTEAGFLRNATAPRPGQISMVAATALLANIVEHPGYRYLAINSDWQTLCGPFFKRVYGTKQVTDAYLLGLAIQNDLVLVTLDKAILHIAGAEYRKHVLLLEAK